MERAIQIVYYCSKYHDTLLDYYVFLSRNIEIYIVFKLHIY